MHSRADPTHVVTGTAGPRNWAHWGELGAFEARSGPRAHPLRLYAPSCRDGYRCSPTLSEARDTSSAWTWNDERGLVVFEAAPIVLDEETRRILEARVRAATARRGDLKRRGSCCWPPPGCRLGRPPAGRHARVACTRRAATTGSTARSADVGAEARCATAALWPDGQLKREEVPTQNVKTSRPVACPRQDSNLRPAA